MIRLPIIYFGVKVDFFSENLGQCWACWWPGCLRRQGFISHVIDYVNEQYKLQLYLYVCLKNQSVND